jgi:hypothetical protein
VVGLGEAHILEEHHDLLQTLISDPRLPEVVDDIVVEFGNARYQDMIDKFILDVQPVNDTDLRLVWRNTTTSPLATWDSPVYEQFFRRVRAVNWTLPRKQRIRVLLGDPPIDWSTITRPRELAAFSARRDTHAAFVVEREVLAKGRRALLCYGLDHVIHGQRDVVTLIEQRTGVRTYVIVDPVGLPGLPEDPVGLDQKLARYPRGTVIAAAGTWLGRYPLCGGSLGEIVDAALCLGPSAQLTASWPNPVIFLDPAYWAELHRRNAIWARLGSRVDLNTFRQQQPPAYPRGGQRATIAC